MLFRFPFESYVGQKVERLLHCYVYGLEFQSPEKMHIPAFPSSKAPGSLSLTQKTVQLARVAFNHPERFSCACINGIWAFYEDPCQSPVAIIGGDNHCFQMPSDAISLALIVSNPLRGLGESITVFDGDMEGIRSKAYRNIKIDMDDADKFISLNSSWTVTSSDGSKSICLESRNVVFEGLTSEEEDAFPSLTYCSFAGVNQEMPFIGNVRKGCNTSMVLEPLECQPILPSTDEKKVCLNEDIIVAYNDEVDGNLNPVTADRDDDGSKMSNQRLSRALKVLGRFARQEVPTPAPTGQAPPPPTAPPAPPSRFASTYYNEPEWHKRWVAINPGNTDQSSSSPLPPPRARNISIDRLWNNPAAFLNVGFEEQDPNSSELIRNHLWMQQRLAIRNALNITRLVPPEEENDAQVNDGRVAKLLQVHAGIMKKICPLAEGSFFDIAVGTFMSVLTKGFRWKEPYVEQTTYLRILASLTTCKNSAEMMKFAAADPNQCSSKSANFITLRDVQGDGEVNVKLDSLDVFKSEKFEPIIETVWKSFVAVHSYCYKDFRDQYQDHHKYTTLMVGLFSKRLQDIWTRNKTIYFEYGGVLGNLVEAVKGITSCTMGARLTSEYPFHLTRPSKKAKEPRLRRRRSVEKVKAEKTGKSEIIHSRKKRLAVNSFNSDTASKSIFDGKGICLRKYGDPRSTIGRTCKTESTTTINPKIKTS